MDGRQKQIDKAFYSDGYQLGISAIKAPCSNESLFTAVQQMYAAIDGLIDALTPYAAQQNQKIDCERGCHWCCHQPVYALSYELDYLNHFLIQQFDAKKQQTIRARAKHKNDKLKGLSGKALLNAKVPCPLLENGTCMAYEARPMACRVYLSYNVSTCLLFFHEPNHPENYPALLNLPLRAGRMMNEGFKAALKSGGMMAQEYRLEEKILTNDEPDKIAHTNEES